MIRLLLVLLALIAPFNAASQELQTYITLEEATLKVDGGTGFLITHNRHNYIVTNEHVCGDKETLTPSSVMIPKVKYRAKILISDYTTDLCILTVPFDDDQLRHIKLIGIDEMPIGSRVYSSGYPAPPNGLGYVKPQLVHTEGTIVKKSQVALRYTKEDTRIIELVDTTMLGAQGCSGSPVLSDSGALLGVVNSIKQESPTSPINLSYIPVNALIKLLERLN